MKIFYFIFIFTSPLFLLSQELAWKNIGIKDGLPSSEVYQVLQDKKGFIWFATDAGPCIYDGEKIRTFTAKDGLPESVVLGMYEDPKGRIWFRGFSGSLSYYEDGVITSVKANAELCGILKPNGLITSLFLGGGDTLFCGTSKPIGLVKVAPQNNYEKVFIYKFIVKNSDAFVIQNSANRDIVYGRSGSDLFCDSVTHYLCDGPANKLSYIQTLSAKTNRSQFRCFVSHTRKIYIANTKNLISIDGNSIINKDFPATINCIFVDKKNNLWIGLYRHGLFLFRNSDLSSTPLQFLKNSPTSSVFIDNENSLWVTTLDRGAMECLNTNILQYNNEDARVGCFFRDDSILYIGLNGQPKILMATASRGVICETPLNIQEPEDLLGMTHLGKSWFYATSSGIIKSTVTGHLAKFDFPIYAKSILRLNDTTMALASRSTFLISNEKGIVSKYVLPDYVPCIAITKSKKILFGTNKMGILEFRDNNFFPFADSTNNIHSRINFLGEGRKNELWVGTNENGVFVYNENSPTNISEKEGLASNKIYDITFDQNGSAWVATNKGLSRVNFNPSRARYEIISYYEADGLPSNEILKIAILGNKLFCATRQGFFYFNITDLVKNTTPPGVFVSSFKINGTEWKYGRNKDLAYNQNNLTIDLVGLTFRGKNDNNFTYKLEGFDHDFSNTSYSQIGYTNLPPGNYVFIAYALNHSGTKSIGPIMISFTIAKPFWLKLWFIIPAGLAFALLLYQFVRWRLYIVKKTADEKTQLNKKLSEYKMSALQSQMNPHFIFNAINSIQHYILSNKPESAYHYLSQFAHLVRLVLKNSRQRTISLEQEIETLSLYLELEEIRFSIPFKYSIHIDENLDKEDIHIVPMLIQPFVENAIKHGLMPKNDNALLEISFALRNNSIYITITDNGIGRLASQQNKANNAHISTAISNTIERTELINEYTGEGAKINIVDLADHNGFASGTKVEVMLPFTVD